MSLSEVQQRTTELDARLRQLTGARLAAGLPVAPTSTAAPAGSSSSGTSAFASQLAEALAPAGPAPAASAAAAAHTAPTRGPGGASAGPRVTGEQVVALAKEQLGTPYEWGGESPGGFDCSGLIQWAYGTFGIELPRVSTDQARAGRAVKPEDARPGDLVFFERGRVDHIGLYAGGGKWVVAPKTGDVVKVQDVDLHAATTIRRVLPEAAVRTSGGPGAAAATALASSLVGLPAAGRRFAADIVAAARREDVDPRLLAAVAWSESGFNPSARSPAGALGLMQIMPRTAAGLGVDPLDPQDALRGGARYLSQQLKAFGGREDLALAAYNAGPGAVRKYGGIPPYAETQGYVRTVLGRFSALGGQV